LPREVVATQLQFRGGYNRNAVLLFVGEVQRARGQPAVDGLIREFDLETVFGLKPGKACGRVGR
jgi:hypothetical protein